MTRLAVLFWMSVTAFVNAAEPPKIDRVSPPGGQLGTTVDVKLFGKPGDGPLRVSSELSQLTFEFSEKQDTAKVTVPADATPGRHWLRFFNDHGATDLRPFIVGVIAESAEVEPNNKIDEAQKIESASLLINGLLEKTDEVDTFALSLKAGQTLVASLEANGQLGSPMDAVLQVLDSVGTAVAQNDDDHATDPQIAFDVTTDGTYYVRTFAFPSAPNSTVRMAGGADYVYRLTLTTEPFVDHVSPAVADASGEATFNVQGWNLSDELRSVKLAPVKNATAWIHAGFANAHPISALNIPAQTEQSEHPQPVVVPGSITGCISGVDETDTYTFQGTKNQKLIISADCRSINSLLDPVVIVSDADGKVLKESDDRSRDDLDSEAAVTLKADGAHTISISDRYQDGGARFYYVLRCEESRPEFSTTVKSNAFVLPTDKPLEIPVTVSRTNGMAEVITFSMTGLPDGISVEAVESQKDGDTAKAVTLKVVRTETAPAFSGVVTIVGKSTSGDERSATSPIQNSTDVTARIWLTVIANATVDAAATDSESKTE